MRQIARKELGKYEEFRAPAPAGGGRV
jgi:hypothetical protein